MTRQNSASGNRNFRWEECNDDSVDSGRRKGKETVRLQLPASPAEIGEAFASLDRIIEVLYANGETVKLEEHFDSPEHAVNVIRRMLHVSGMVLDNASPAVLGHLSKNIRIAVLKTPLVDEDVGITASIRIVNPQNMQKEDFVKGGTATGPMLDFLSACLRYGVSVCVAGATGSGKTTVAGWLLTTIPDNKRIFRKI